MYTIVIYISIGVLLYLLYLAFKTFRYKGAPPGPIGYPIIGSFVRCTNPTLFENIPKYAKIYGNVYQMTLFHINFVFLCGYDVIKDVLRDRGTQFSDRYFSGLMEVHKMGLNAGIVSVPYGPKWAAHRKLFHTSMKKMGFNKTGLENAIESELPYIEEIMQSHCDRNILIDPSQTFDFAALNIISGISMGERYDYDDQKFKKLIDLNHTVFKFLAKPDALGSLYILYPSLSKIFLTSTTKHIQNAYKQFYAFFENEIEFHKDNLDRNAPKDFIDHYLIEMDSENTGIFTPDDLKMSLVDFFQAGTETTATTLTWAILYMVNNPEIQEKCHKEIKTVIGTGKVKYSDKSKLPFCDATILESQRRSTIAPIGLMHTPSHDETICGYKVTKNTLLFPWFPSLHYSTKHWKNPHEFDPSNFLDEDGTVGHREAFFPYGGGRRICLGMEIAKMELFMFFVGILQRYKFSLPEGGSKLSEKPVEGMTQTPAKFKVVIENMI